MYTSWFLLERHCRFYVRCILPAIREFQAEDLVNVRMKYWNMSQNDQTDFLVNLLREAFDFDNQKMKYYLGVGDGNAIDVCQGAFKRCFGISNTKMTTLMTKLKAGI